MKIIQLKSQNVKALKAVEINPEGNLVVIGGKNGQGKSSVLDSIIYALEGKGAICDKPVRKGRQEARIICKLDNLKITRTMYSDGKSKLTVENNDGAVFKSPQSMLNELYGKIGFDPLEFERMDNKAQFELLRDLVGVDLNEYDEKIKELFEERRDINREVKRLQSVLVSMTKHDDLPDEETAVSDLVKELKQKEEKNKENQLLRDKIEEGKVDLKECQSEIEQKEKELEELKSEFKKLDEDHKKAVEQASELVDEDTAELEKQIESCEEINAKIRQNKLYEETESSLNDEMESAETKTDKIKELEEEKTELIEKAKFPVDGLSFRENQVLYNGLPFDQCSSAERQRISVMIGIALNPKLRVLIIKDGSLLDGDNLKAMYEIADENECQIWLERVGEGEECHVIIEDGQVKD